MPLLWGKKHLALRPLLWSTFVCDSGLFLEQNENGTLDLPVYAKSGDCRRMKVPEQALHLEGPAAQVRRLTSGRQTRYEADGEFVSQEQSCSMQSWILEAGITYATYHSFAEAERLIPQDKQI